MLCGLISPVEAGFKDGMAAHAKGDFASALFEFRKSAERGDGLSQFRLGSMYLKGQGVDRDPVQAYLWFDLASMYLAAGPKQDQASQNRNNLAGNMTAKQIATAKGLVEGWKTRIAHNLVKPSPLPMPAAGHARSPGATR